MNDLALYHMGYDGHSYEHVKQFLVGKKNISAYHHPRVIKWILMESPILTVVPKAYRERAAGQRAYTTPGIAGSVLSDADAVKLYQKSMKVVLKKPIDPVDEWNRLSAMESAVTQKKCPAMSPYWTDTLASSGKHTTLDELQRACERLFRDAVDVAANSVQVNLSKWKVRWEDRGYPISVATYTDSTVTLDKWVLVHFRRCDLAVMIVHEIIGHHHQESIAPTDVSEQAEACAMLSEKICARPIWVDPETGQPCSLDGAVQDWKLFRILRAMVDLHLHSRAVRRLYPDPTETIWTRYPVMEKHIVPIASELDRVAALPGQALGYVRPVKKRIPGCIF